MYILKSRQIGFSTWYQARIYERIRRHPNTFALSLAHDNAGLSWIYPDVFEVPRPRQGPSAHAVFEPSAGVV